MSRTNDTVRTECYQLVRECLKRGIAKFYRENPELTGDERSQVAIDRSMEGLRCIFAVLDGYKIERKDD